MSYTPRTQNQGNNQQQDDNKVFARHVMVKETKTGGSILTMFFSNDEAAELVNQLSQALELTQKGEAEGAVISVVTGEGSNGKPYALAGAKPIYPRQQDQGAPKPQGGSTYGKKPAYQPKTNFKPRTLG